MRLPARAQGRGRPACSAAASLPHALHGLAAALNSLALPLGGAFLCDAERLRDAAARFAARVSSALPVSKTGPGSTRGLSIAPGVAIGTTAAVEHTACTKTSAPARTGCGGTLDEGELWQGNWQLGLAIRKSTAQASGALLNAAAAGRWRRACLQWTRQGFVRLVLLGSRSTGQLWR